MYVTTKSVAYTIQDVLQNAIVHNTFTDMSFVNNFKGT